MKVNGVVVVDFGHGRRGVDVGTIGRNGVDGGQQDGFLDLLLGEHCIDGGLGKDGDADVDGGGIGIGVEIRNIGKVNGGGVIDSLETAAGVEVADRLAGVGRDGNRTLCVVDGGAKGTRVGQFVGRKTRGELIFGAGCRKRALLALSTQASQIAREVESRALRGEKRGKGSRASHVESTRLLAGGGNGLEGAGRGS